MNPDEFHEALHRVAPPAPEATGWAAAARRRSLRRRALTAAGALAAVIAAGTLVAVNLPARVGTVVPAAPATSPVAPPGGSPAPGDPCHLTEPTAGDIPEEALWLRLCPYDDPTQLTPADALDTAGAHEVLAVLRDQRSLAPNPTCRADLGPSFLLVAEYSGREPVAMELRLYGCGTAGTSTDRRTGAEAVFDAFRAALLRQRDQSVPPAPAPSCAAGTLLQGSVMPIGPADVVAGVACSSAAGESHQRRMDADQLAEVLADVAAHSDPRAESSCPAGPTTGLPEALVLVNSWADRLVLSTQPCPDSYTYLADGSQWRWTPSAPVRRLLESLHG